MDGEEQAGGNQQAGMVLSVFGCMLISAAANYLNHFYSLLEKRTKIWSDNTTLVTIWLVYLGGSFCAGYSVTYMNLILATSTPSVLFVFNIIFRYLLEGDLPNVQALCGIVMIIIGIVTFGYSTSNIQKVETIEKMKEHLSELQYLSYTGTSFSAAISTIIINEYFQNCNNPSQDSLDNDAVSTDTFAVEPVHYNPEPIAYCFSSAIIGGQRKIFLAGVFLLLFPERLYQPELYIFLLIAVFTAAFWFYRVGRMINMFDGRFIIPFYQSLGILVEILTACVFHKFFDSVKTPELFGFFLGSFLVFAGIYLISTSTTQSNNRISNHLCST